MHDFVRPQERLGVKTPRRTAARPLASLAMVHRLAGAAARTLRALVLAAAVAALAAWTTIWLAQAFEGKSSTGAACLSPAEHGVHVWLRDPLRAAAQAARSHGKHT